MHTKDGLPQFINRATYSNRDFSGYNMTIHPKHNVPTKSATDLLRDGQALIDFYVDGEIKIESNEVWDKEVIITNCVMEYFSGSITQFEKPVRFVNCHFKKCQFVFTYFLGGLTIDNCIFDDYLDFQAGGYNKTGNPVTITNNEFAEFVNFFDCCYEGQVIIKNNRFRKGTNLLGKPFNIPVTFDIDPIIENNLGQLDFDNE